MAKTGFDEPLINPKASRPFYKNSGVFKVTNVEPLLTLTPCFGYKLTLHGKKLERKDANGSSDPFLVILASPMPQDSMPGAYHSVSNDQGSPPAAVPQPTAVKDKKSKKTKRNKAEGETGSKKVIYKTEVIKKNLNPNWKSFDLSVGECGGLDSPITIDCYDWDDDGKIDFIGSVKTTLRQMGNVGKQHTLYVFLIYLLTLRHAMADPEPRQGRTSAQQRNFADNCVDQADHAAARPAFRLQSDHQC